MKTNTKNNLNNSQKKHLRESAGLFVKNYSEVMKKLSGN
jgi:hypothetical protein